MYQIATRYQVPDPVAGTVAPCTPGRLAYRPGLPVSKMPFWATLNLSLWDAGILR